MSAEEIIELGDAERIPTSTHVTQAIQTGLPLESGLRALAEQMRSRSTRNALLTLSEKLEQGIPLAVAIEGLDATLPPSMSSLVAAGLETGRLDCVMKYSVEQSQRSIGLRQQIWIFLAYPLFLIWFSTVICGAVLLTLMPTFAKIFDDFGTELPGLTVALIGVSKLMNTIGVLPWVTMACAFPIAALSLMFLGASPAGRRWSTSIPVVGRCFHYAAMNDLCRLLALLAESGLPLSNALRFAGNASDDRWLARKCRIVSMDIEDGTPPGTAASLADLPNSLSQVFRSARSERTFAQALRGLADIYAAQCLVNSQLVNSIFAPLSVTVVLGFVGITAISMFLPLIKLLNDLS